MALRKRQSGCIAPSGPSGMLHAQQFNCSCHVTNHRPSSSPPQQKQPCYCKQASDPVTPINHILTCIVCPPSMAPRNEFVAQGHIACTSAVLHKSTPTCIVCPPSMAPRKSPSGFNARLICASAPCHKTSSAVQAVHAQSEST
jgi:hypothetical protein